MVVYVIEFLRDKSFISKIISKITKKQYTHTGMFMNGFFCELDAINDRKKEPDYHLVHYGSIKKYLQNNLEKNRTEAYTIPKSFLKTDIEKGITWWKEKQDSKKWYGYTKLLSFLITAPLRPFYRWYYKKKGRPFQSKISRKKTDVCSVAVDKCLKVMGFDAFPEYVERITYPGLFANKFKRYKE